ncbi:MAG: succinate dehydrogenase/fumarate reductase iron-sulfur subunit [Candidatus Lambdaproteobacteria bacterium]|nr:succinate dehydrogenase/fumarate reductase iron-sulfur subunit [Candidatus Lambdaproteobacteria bacterium]
MAGTLTVRIRRSDGSGAAATPPGPPRFDTFRVEPEPKMNVLDVVAKIQATQDPSLAFRYSCRAGMCGTCSMRVNGKNRWTCRTQVEKLGTDLLVIEPLPHYPVIRDLAVDMAPFVESMRLVIPQFVPAEPGKATFAKIGSGSRERREIDPHIECITCGNCYGECSLVETNKAYLGPAALNRAFTLIADSRDGAARARLELVNGHDGVWGCHTQFNCTEVCPLGISPTRAIQKLKRKELLHALTPHLR